ncbi:sialin-like [Anoplophora glabripennis]|uniref:sialin-like n=1 Tax=Anoplophora glabripennis TaxID=217634 RepID=UPI000C792707|nr:sialin-like [Anoplophora glabripennis]
MCDTEENKKLGDEQKSGGCFGVRYMQYILYFAALNIAYGIRSVLSVGIYAMIADDPPSKDIPTYPEWANMKNIMLSSFFWGYICFQIGAGQLAKNYGPKLFLGGTTLIGSLFCLLIPLFGKYFGYGGVIACRVMTGLSQGFIFPCVHTLLSSWAPVQDRAKISTFAYAGGPLGSVISMPVTGFISNSIGWPVAFYLYGGLGAAWSVIWFFVGSDSPSKHPNISDEERKYIEAGLQNDDDKENIPTPWKAIFTSLPFWAILVTHCGQNWGFWTLFTEIPSYMQNILNFNIASVSILSFKLFIFTIIRIFQTYPEWANMKNIMLSSFFWGYICFQIGAGQLAKNYGPKLFLGGTTLIGSLFCLLIPLFGKYFGYGGVIACRVMTGLSQGFIFPCVHTLLSSWAPVQDRAKISTFAYAGGPLGSVISMPVTGFISNSIGWPVAFYLYGGLGAAWSVIWFFVGSDSPSKHPNISDEERKYIEAGLQNDDDKENIPTPWKAIFTSLPFWAILVTHCGQNWGFWTLFTEIPSYMQNILNFNIASNSTLSALPYLVLWLLSLVLSPIADYLIVKNFTTGASRKIFNSIGLYCPAVALISLSFVENDQRALTIAILVLGVGFNAAIFCGYHINHIDLSPVHAGTLMGITNCFSNIFSLLGPLAIDAIKALTGYEETDKSLWTIVFCIAAGIFMSVATFYNFAASGEVQPWNYNVEKKENRSNEKIV